MCLSESLDRMKKLMFCPNCNTRKVVIISKQWQTEFSTLKNILNLQWDWKWDPYAVKTFCAIRDAFLMALLNKMLVPLSHNVQKVMYPDYIFDHCSDPREVCKVENIVRNTLMDQQQIIKQNRKKNTKQQQIQKQPRQLQSWSLFPTEDPHNSHHCLTDFGPVRILIKIRDSFTKILHKGCTLLAWLWVKVSSPWTQNGKICLKHPRQHT